MSEVLHLAASPSPGWLLDAAGRKVLDLGPGVNDVRGLSPGIYFVVEARTVLKVVLTD